MSASIFVVILVGLAAALSARAPAAAGDHGQRRAVLAAPWPLSKADTDFYQMVIMDDGYPGKRVDGRLVAHPIYASYLMAGYLRDARSGDRRSKAALSAVARAAVNRMSSFHGTLVFWYTKDTIPIPAVGPRSYSALTQARYAVLLAQAARVLHDTDLLADAEKVFNSLLVPVMAGGVMRPGRLGPVLEEAPTAVPSAILNGWLSALVAVESYAKLTHSARAAELLRASSAELAARLPRYDLPDLRGSAYGASALLTVRVDAPVGTTIRSGALVVDGVEIPLTVHRRTWTSQAVRVLSCGKYSDSGIRVTCPQLLMNVPVSGGGIDPTSVIRLGLAGAGDAPLSAELRLPRYDFRYGPGRTVAGWEDPIRVSAKKSAATVLLSVTARRLRAAQAPTIFLRYGGRMINNYHGIHISRLRILAGQGGPVFVRYAERWERYRCDWAGHAAYARIPRADLPCPAGATRPAARTTPATAPSTLAGRTTNGSPGADGSSGPHGSPGPGVDSWGGGSPGAGKPVPGAWLPTRPGWAARTARAIRAART